MRFAGRRGWRTDADAGRRDVRFAAGWLFADLALVLFLVALSSGDPVRAAPPPAPTSNPAAVTETQRPLSVSPKPLIVRVRAGAGWNASPSSGTTARLRKELQRKLASLSGRRAAFVLTFGRTSDPGTGVSLARSGNALLRSAVPQLMQDCATRDFWDGSSGEPAGTIRYEIYLFA